MSSQEPPTPLYCTRCGESALPGATFCIWCGTALGSEQGEDVRSVAYLLNQLAEMRRRNEISLDLYHSVLVRYGELLERLQAPRSAALEKPVQAPASPRPPAPVERRPAAPGPRSSRASPRSPTTGGSGRAQPFRYVGRRCLLGGEPGAQPASVRWRVPHGYGCADLRGRRWRGRHRRRAVCSDPGLHRWLCCCRLGMLPVSQGCPSRTGVFRYRRGH